MKLNIQNKNSVRLILLYECSHQTSLLTETSKNIPLLFNKTDKADHALHKSFHIFSAIKIDNKNLL